MDKVNKQELRRLAEAATPGPWKECGHARGGCSCGMVWSRAADLPVAEAWRGDQEAPEPAEGAKANAAFIAAANPAAILSLLDELERAESDAERLRMQLAACGVVAMCNTAESAAKARDMHPDYMSASCQDVMRAVDTEMALREELEQYRKDAERLNWLTEKGKQEDPEQGDVRAYIDAAMAKEGGANG